MIVTQKQIEYGFGKCRTCSKVRPLGDFKTWRSGNATVRGHSCFRCGCAASEGPNAQFIRAAKDKPCADCGQRFPAVCMDFDHRPERGKSFNIAGMRTHSLAVIAREIRKCDVVCACCHRLRTAARGYVGAGRPKRAARVVLPDLVD